MPVDRFRITGPQDAVDITSFPIHPADKSEVKVSILSIEDDDIENAKYYMNTGVLNQATGSAYIEHGRTKVVCAVNGPMEVSKRDLVGMDGVLDVKFKFAPFSSEQRRDNQPSAEERRLSQVLRQSLEAAVILSKYPKAKYEIHVLVLEDGGSALATAQTCAGLALADAGTQMYDIVVGVRIQHMSLAVLPSVRQITGLVCEDQALSVRELKQLTERCFNRCAEVSILARHCLKKKFQTKATSNE